MKRTAVIAAFAALAAPALAQVPFQYLLEVTSNDAASKAGWQWTDVKQGFNTSGAGNGFALPVDVVEGRTYFLAAGCAKPCTKVGLMLLTEDQKPVGDTVFGAPSGETQLATRTWTAPATGKFLLVTAIAECPEAACPGSASLYMTRAE